jgi:O-succinylbenzoate synthase
MRFDSVTLHEIALQLIAPFETSFGRTTARRIIIVELSAGDLTGWGECTASEDPYFNEEFTDGAWELIRSFVVPRLIDVEVDEPESIAAALSPIRGNRMARAAVETAAWDLCARSREVPLWRLLGGDRPSIECGVSIGLQASVDDLLANVARELASGYRRIKIKIAPGRDVALVAAVRDRFGDIVLSVDANSAYSLADLHTLERLDAFGLLMIEQPLRPGDLIDHAKLQSRLSTSICLDESIVDDESCRQALEIGACRIVNIKLGRVGGHTEARRIAKRCADAGIPVWCGGMLEAGIGRMHNAAMSSMSAFTLPGDVSDSRRYWTDDIVVPRPTVEPDGTMRLPELPGIGVGARRERIDELATRTWTWRRGRT